MSTSDGGVPRLVSCILPTGDRRRFVPGAIECFQAQTYPHRELVVVDDGSDPVGDLVPDDPSIRYVRLDRRLPLGAKRNLACARSAGEVIVHWDDDDWSAPERVEAQVHELVARGADLCGLRELLFYEPAADRAWRYSYPASARPWVAGGTLCYWRRVWEAHPFPDVRQGEDTQFVWSDRSLRVRALDRLDLYLATIHPANTSPKRTAGRRWSSVPVADVRSMLGPGASRHLRSAARHEVAPAPTTKEPPGMVTAAAPPATTSTSDPAPCRPATASGDRVTVSIPHHGPATLLRPAVESILSQTHRQLTCVVVFDGDPDGLEAIADIDDVRLVRHVLGENRGRYFADQVVLDATTDPYFLVQDSDDWSEPTRIERLLDELARTGADVCVSDVVHHDDRTGAGSTARHSWPRLLEPVGPTYIHRAGHQGLYRAGVLRAIGGFDAGYRIGFDTSVLNLVLLAGGRVVAVPEPLYHRNIRNGSLSTSPATGWNTPARRRVVHELRELHRRAYDATRGLEAGEARRVIHHLVRSARSPEADAALRREVSALAASLPLPEAPAPAGTVAERTGPPARPTVRRRVPDVGQVLDLPGAGNPGWAIARSGAVELYHRVLARRPARILDVGSGLSTAVVAAAAARYGGTVTALEHDPRFAERTRRLLAEAGLTGAAEVLVAPLARASADPGSGPWYQGQPSGTFDFFVVDGPPQGAGGRMAALPALADHRSDDWELWLFDAHRPDEQRCLAAWGERYRFTSSVLPLDPTGVAVLRPVTGGAAGATPVVDGLGVSILAGGRPDLLERTLTTFASRWRRQVEAAHVCALVNGADERSVAVVEAAGWIDRTLTYDAEALTIGMATSVVVGSVLGHGSVRHLLHLEDDWETRTVDGDALVRAAGLLDDTTIGQVRLRHASEPCLGHHMVTGGPIAWARHDGHRRGVAHFTFNPSLVRREVADRVFPARDERDAQRRFLGTGLDVVQLEPGVFGHLGDGRSRRAGLRRRR